MTIFHLAVINQESMHVDPDKVTLHQVTVYGEESQDGKDI